MPMDVRMFSILRRFVVMLGIALGAAASAGAQVSVDRLELHFYPGRDSVAGTVGIRNDSDSTQQVRLFLLDWVRDSAGANVYSPVGSHEASCGSRVEVFPLTMQLGARRSEFARVTYTPTGPDDPGCWLIVMIEPVRPPEPPNVGRMGAVITVQTGVKVYVHPVRSVPSAAVEYADAEERYIYSVPNAAGRVDSTLVRDLVVRFVNTGNDHLIVSSSADIRDASTQLVAQVTGPRAYITPGAFRDIILRVPATLPSGSYVALVMLDTGGEEVQAAQIEFVVP